MQVDAGTSIISELTKTEISKKVGHFGYIIHYTSNSGQLYSLFLATYMLKLINNYYLKPENNGKRNLGQNLPLTCFIVFQKYGDPVNNKSYVLVINSLEGQCVPHTVLVLIL